jgi:hypothetical protein
MALGALLENLTIAATNSACVVCFRAASSPVEKPSLMFQSILIQTFRRTLWFRAFQAQREPTTTAHSAIER